MITRLVTDRSRWGSAPIPLPFAARATAMSRVLIRFHHEMTLSHDLRLVLAAMALQQRGVAGHSADDMPR